MEENNGRKIKVEISEKERKKENLRKYIEQQREGK